MIEMSRSRAGSAIALSDFERSSACDWVSGSRVSGAQHAAASITGSRVIVLMARAYQILTHINMLRILNTSMRIDSRRIAKDMP